MSERDENRDRRLSDVTEAIKKVKDLSERRAIRKARAIEIQNNKLDSIVDIIGSSKENRQR